MQIKGAKVIQTALLEKWEIWTGMYRTKDGWMSAKNRYPIQEDTLEQIALDYLVKKIEGQKLHVFELLDKSKYGKREKITITMERDGYVENTNKREIKGDE
ncbi:MAG: hypothetical protein PHS36_08760 [Candidatus Cloacimonetes bacterium]|nr:hypothetical protein [Candidatus Cloacimonadota bacterium]